MISQPKKPVIGAIEYEVMSGHIHQLIIDAGELLTGDVIEELAGELAEAVLNCNDDRHQGHGRKHTMDDAQKAYSAAVQQLLITDFRHEQEELDRKIRVHKKWGGQVPAAVFMPDTVDGGKWNVMVPDDEGEPVMRRVRDGVLDDILPTPEQAGAKRDPYGIGWVAPRRWKTKTRLRKMRDRNNKGK